MATTPPGQSVLRLPPTPLHGAGYDRYEPYSPRKSTRTRRAQPARQITPEPVHTRATSAKRASNTSTALSSHEQISTHGFSPPSSAQSSPQNNSNKSSKPGPQHSSEVMRNEFGPTAPSLGQPTLQPTTLLAGTTMAEGMLPTPVKTPRKKQVADVNQAARALFQNQPESFDDVMPAPKQGRKNRKYNGFSLESFEAEDGSSEPHIQIFTDSKEKIPEIDDSEDNPFYTKPGKAAPSSSRASKRRKISGETKDEEVEEHIRRDDGIIYVHRRRKVFRKFEDEEGSQDDPEARALHAEYPGIQMPSPLIRSSIKPRLLFPTAEQRREREARDTMAAAKPNTTSEEEDEEADTDIENENDLIGAHIDTDGIDIIDTLPVANGKKTESDTPVHRLAPYESIAPASHNLSTASTIQLHEETLVSPPTPVRNLRSTRSSAKKGIIPEEETVGETGGKDPKDGKVSPFLGWKRTKSATAAAAGAKGRNKRSSDDFADAIGGSATKKTKGK